EENVHLGGARRKVRVFPERVRPGRSSNPGLEGIERKKDSFRIDRGGGVEDDLLERKLHPAPLLENTLPAPSHACKRTCQPDRIEAELHALRRTMSHSGTIQPTALLRIGIREAIR